MDFWVSWLCVQLIPCKVVTYWYRDIGIMPHNIKGRISTICISGGVLVQVDPPSMAPCLIVLPYHFSHLTD